MRITTSGWVGERELKKEVTLLDQRERRKGGVREAGGKGKEEGFDRDGEDRLCGEGTIQQGPLRTSPT